MAQDPHSPNPGSPSDASPSDVNDQFIETLLQESYHPDTDEDGTRIDQLMERIHRERQDPLTQVQLGESPLPTTSRSWHRMAIAACVLIACGFAGVIMSRSNSAYAAVLRAIESDLPPREYHVQMTNRWPVVGRRDVTAKLYVNNREEFCVWHPGWLPGGEIWVGGDMDSRWIVPRVGPVITGDEDFIASALLGQGLGSPMLHLQTLLTRMSQEYDLELLDDESITTPYRPGKSILCRHVSGIRDSADGVAPMQIDLWANRETGVAERVVLVWTQETESWLPLRWQIDLAAFPELSSDWFEFQGHSDPSRLILPMQVGTPVEPSPLKER